MVPGLKILCTSHQAKIAICCQMPLVAQIGESKLAIRIVF